ncbi:MAG: acyltransferase [Clostridia bacterium]|nr:acyltransferase [Clostridia bacterium]
MARNKLADSLKGYSCLLVVFGHVIFGIQNMGGVAQPWFASFLKDFIWSFHVALFMFLSGFVYRITGEWKSKKTRWQFILHKALNLGVPYVVFSILYIVINNLIPGTNFSHSLKDILYLWKSPIAQYWFLRTLFCLFVLYTLGSHVLSNVWITVILTALSCAHMLFPELPSFSLGNIISWAFAFGFGACLTSLDSFRFTGARAAAVIAGHVALEAVSLLTGISGMPVVVEIERAAGIIASITLVSLLVQKAPAERFLLFICRYNFPIYLMHTVITAGIRIVLLRVGVHSYAVHVALGMLLGVALPIAAAKVMDKMVWPNLVLYPTQTFKKLKKKRGGAMVQG